MDMQPFQRLLATGDAWCSAMTEHQPSLKPTSARAHQTAADALASSLTTGDSRAGADSELTVGRPRKRRRTIRKVAAQPTLTLSGNTTTNTSITNSKQNNAPAAPPAHVAPPTNFWKVTNLSPRARASTSPTTLIPYTKFPLLRADGRYVLEISRQTPEDIRSANRIPLVHIEVDQGPSQEASLVRLTPQAVVTCQGGQQTRRFILRSPGRRAMSKYLFNVVIDGRTVLRQIYFAATTEFLVSGLWRAVRGVITRQTSNKLRHASWYQDLCSDQDAPLQSWFPPFETSVRAWITTKANRLSLRAISKWLAAHPASDSTPANKRDASKGLKARTRIPDQLSTSQTVASQSAELSSLIAAMATDHIQSIAPPLDMEIADFEIVDALRGLDEAIREEPIPSTHTAQPPLARFAL